MQVQIHIYAHAFFLNPLFGSKLSRDVFIASRNKLKVKKRCWLSGQS